MTVLSSDALAQRWSVSTWTLARWRRQGTGPIFHRQNKQIVYRLADIEAYEQKRLHRSTQQVVGGHPS